MEYHCAILIDNKFETNIIDTYVLSFIFQISMFANNVE